MFLDRETYIKISGAECRVIYPEVWGMESCSCDLRSRPGCRLRGELLAQPEIKRYPCQRKSNFMVVLTLLDHLRLWVSSQPQTPVERHKMGSRIILASIIPSIKLSL
jgi:hypothetical protein